MTSDVSVSQKLTPVHPGEVCRKSSSSRWDSAKTDSRSPLEFRLDASTKSSWANEALRLIPRCDLARYFSMSPQFWMGLQMDYALDVAADELSDRLEREVRPRLETG